MLNTNEMSHSKWWLTLGLGILLSLQTYAQQEICNNGRDDNNDGLVDCFDPTCSCYTCNNEQDNYWVFGNGLSFDFSNLNSQGTPNYTNNTIYLNAQESYASVADPNGKLLFATNGNQIRAGAWNSTLMVINPNNVSLKGGASSSHAAVVIPDPAAQNEYYIFTSDDATNNLHGVNQAKLKFQNQLPSSSYMEAHLSTPLNENLMLAIESTEKLAVARHANCRDYWLVTHDFGQNTSNGKNYISYKIDPNGVGPRVNWAQAQSHVISAGQINSKKGQISFSSDYSMLAAAVQGEGTSSSTAIQGFVELTMFNTSIGSILPYRVLPMDGRHVYGVCFSPSGRYLYATTVSIVGVPDNKLLQYDLLSGPSGTAGNIQEILDSEKEVPVHDNSVIPGTGGDLGQLKVGPNGRIYLAVDGKGIVEIVEPDDPSLSLNTNYLVFTPNTNVRLGLPYTIPDYCQSVDITASNDNTCPGETVNLTANVAGAQYAWSTGQTTSSISVSPQTTTTYSVSMTDSYGCTATNQITVNVQNVPNVTGVFNFEDAVGNSKNIFKCNEDVFMDATGSSAGVSNHYIDIWEVLPDGSLGARLAPLGPTGWQGGPVNGRYNLTNMLAGSVTFEVGRTYEVKLVVIAPPCVIWNANTVPILHRFTIADVTSEFHFEDAEGNQKNTFQCGETIFMDGRGSDGESNHFIDLWEVTSSGVSYIIGLGWQGSPVDNIRNVSTSFPNVQFEPGKTYRVQLATQDPPCVGWVTTVEDFTIVPASADPDFTISFNGGTGSPTAQINLNALHTNSLLLDHNWLIQDLSTGMYVSNIWTVTLPNQPTNETVFLPVGNYRIQHGIINTTEGCQFAESISKNLTLFWEKKANGEEGRITLSHETKEIDFGLFPNPTTNILNISTEEEVEMIHIVDLNGRVIQKTRKLQINVQELPAGLYIVELRTANNVAQKQFIKQ